jgi:hypothetical protein
MTGFVIINFVLSLLAVLAIVGGLAWSIGNSHFVKVAYAD